MQQMPRRYSAAVGHRIQIALAPIPCSMESDSEPQISGATQSQAQKQSDSRDREQSKPVFARISDVQKRKKSRKHQRRGPETNALRQRELRIAARKKLLEQSDNQKKYSPENGKLQYTPAVQRKSAQRKIAHAPNPNHQRPNRHIAPTRAHPERFPKRSAQRKPVLAKLTLLYPSHHHRRDGHNHKRSQLRYQVEPEFNPHMRIDLLQKNSERNPQQSPHHQIQNQPPSRPQPVGAGKHRAPSLKRQML